MGEDAANVKTEPQNSQQDKSSDNNAASGNQGGPGGNQGNQGGGPGGGNRGGHGGGRGGRGGPGGGGGRDRKPGGPGGNRFSGGRGGGGNQGPRGGPGGNMGGMNDMQMKMSESMMENMMDESILGGMGGGMNMGGMQGMGGGRMGGGMGGGGRGGRGGGGRGGGRNNMGGGGGQGGAGGGGAHDRTMGGGRSQDDRLMERIMAISGPTHELPAIDTEEKKFSGRNRLYVGNLTNDVTEEEIQQMFAPYSEVSELFVNKEKNFAFLRLDYHQNAEKAKRELDGSIRKGRVIKVRFAPHSSVVKVKNLTPWISNELLLHAFSVFGDVEKATVIVDERGKSTGEGIVEFARKPSAQMAIRKCSEGCYFLTSSLRPVVVELFEQNDDIDGYPDKNLPKKNPEYFKAREVGPRFAAPGSFEHEYGTRWKQLHELYKQKEDALKRDMLMEEEKLEAQMEYAKYEHETELLREQLRVREADRDRQKREWEMKERQAEEQRVREEKLRRRQSEEMAVRIRRQEEELHRRQQENNMFMQEQAMRGAAGGAGAGGGKNFGNMPNDGIPPERDGYPPVDAGNNMPVDPKSFMDQYNNMERNNRVGYNDDRGQIMDLMDMRVEMGPRGGGGGGGRWQGGNDRQRADDFPNKRRRY